MMPDEALKKILDAETQCAERIREALSISEGMLNVKRTEIEERKRIETLRIRAENSARYESETGEAARLIDSEMKRIERTLEDLYENTELRHEVMRIAVSGIREQD
jgi:predicted methyltransferase